MVRGGSHNTASLKLVTYLTTSPDEFTGKVGTDGETALTGSAGLYEAYYRSADKNSIVYKVVDAGTDTLENYAVYTIGVFVDFPEASEVSRYTGGADDAAPVNGEFFKASNSTEAAVSWKDANGGDWTEEQVKTELSKTSQYVQYGIARTARTVAVSGTPTNIASRAMFFSADNDATLPASASDGATEITASAATKQALSTGATTAVIDNIGEASESTPYVIGTFGLYVEGSEEVDTAIDNLNNGRVIHGDFTVTITKADA